MNRILLANCGEISRFPHRRGDEPARRCGLGELVLVFPTGVGMNHPIAFEEMYRLAVFPTGVGMNR